MARCAVQCYIWSHTRLEIGVHVDWQTVLALTQPSPFLVPRVTGWEPLV
jgi:hypothetical protein